MCRGPSQPIMLVMNNQTLILRGATPDDARALLRLAELDSAPALDDEILMAELDGEVVAALSLSDGRVVANPFRPTADVVALLRLRAGRVSGGARVERRRRLPRLRVRFA
jgi:hypothetical protein